MNAAAEGRLGVTAATALVTGSVIGVGVYGIPAALADFGPISLVSFALVTVGAVALALVFAALSRRSGAAGGPFAYARDAFGEFTGFMTAWTYWVTAWAGNAAIVVALVGYAEVFVNRDHDRGWSIVLALVGLWLPVLVNAIGLRFSGATQTVVTILKIVPLVLVAAIGLALFDPARLGPFVEPGEDVVGALAGASAVALFSYLGIETAAVAAARVADPTRNVARATVAGTAISGVLYLAGTAAVFGLVASARLRESTAPFSDAADAIFPGGWAGGVVAVFAILSGLGCLVGWTLVVGEMPAAAAADRLFPRWFGRERRGVPLLGIVVSTALASTLTVTAYTSFENVFTTVLLLTVFTSVVPYLFSVGAQLIALVHGRRPPRARFVRDLVIALVALAFTFWCLVGSGQQAVFLGTVCLLLAVPLYVATGAARRRSQRDAEAVRESAGAS